MCGEGVVGRGYCTVPSQDCQVEEEGDIFFGAKKLPHSQWCVLAHGHHRGSPFLQCRDVLQKEKKLSLHPWNPCATWKLELTKKQLPHTLSSEPIRFLKLFLKGSHKIWLQNTAFSSSALSIMIRVEKKNYEKHECTFKCINTSKESDVAETGLAQWSSTWAWGPKVRPKKLKWAWGFHWAWSGPHIN